MTDKEIVKKLIFDVAVEAVIAKVTALPFFSIPVIGPFVGFIVGNIIFKIADAIFDAIARSVAYFVIDFKTEADRAAYQTAADALKESLSQSPEEIERAKADFKDRLRKLIRFDV